MKQKKLIIIGAGSAYTPEIIDEIIRRQSRLSIGEIVLVDVEDGYERAKIILNFARRMFEHAGISCRVSLTLNRREALPGADFVISQIRVGGWQARAEDERIGLSLGLIGQETTGCGGFMSIAGNSKKIIFCGTFTNGLKIQTGDGKLTITEEGKKHKFVQKVGEITFAGKVAAKNKKDVTYVTERCVFRLEEDGLHLVEVAPGIDIKTQILDQMDFAPIVDENVKLMDERIFRDEVMGLTL